MIPPIRWDLVAEALRYYHIRGYRYLEVPWVVSDEALAATLPPGHEATRCQDGPLVGSAEQSFLHLMLEGKMPKGRFLAATPCFRDDTEDDLHQRRFFKVELIEYFGEDGFPTTYSRDELVRAMAWQALRFFCEKTSAIKADIVPVGEHMVDIELEGIELGSYGLRTIGSHSWVYGTGFAEPRYSIAIQKRPPPEFDENGLSRHCTWCVRINGAAHFWTTAHRPSIEAKRDELAAENPDKVVEIGQFRLAFPRW